MSPAPDWSAPVFETAAKISSSWSLAAFAVAAILALASRLVGKGRRGPTPPIAWAAVAAITLLALVPIAARAWGDRVPATPGVYRVRTTVVDRANTPVEDAHVWSDQGGEGKRVAGGWEFDIPAGTIAAGRRLVVRAARPDAFETAADSLPLARDYNPSLTLHLRADTSAMVRGTVVDARGRAIAGARVSVEGYAAESAVTDASGGFVLPAHAAEGQQVRLRAEKPGMGATTLYHPAGREVATLQLDLDRSARRR